MKSRQLVLGLALATQLVLGSAYAQSGMRADEVKKNPDQYRVGDSSDLQADQWQVDQNKVRKENQKEFSQHQKNIHNKHLLKNEI
jgi:hypothetical protein